jgi:hypothetical protein
MVGYGPPLLEPFLRNRLGYYDAIFISRPHNMKIFKPILDGHPEWFENTTVIYDAEAVFATREITYRQLNGPPLTQEEVQGLLRKRCGSHRRRIVLSRSPLKMPTIFEIWASKTCELSDTRSLQLQRRAVSMNGAGSSLSEPFTKKRARTAIPSFGFLETILPKIQAKLGGNVSFIMAGR